MHDPAATQSAPMLAASSITTVCPAPPKTAICSAQLLTSKECMQLHRLLCTGLRRMAVTRTAAASTPLNTRLHMVPRMQNIPQPHNWRCSRGLQRPSQTAADTIVQVGQPAVRPATSKNVPAAPSALQPPSCLSVSATVGSRVWCLQATPLSPLATALSACRTHPSYALTRTAMDPEHSASCKATP